MIYNVRLRKNFYIGFFVFIHIYFFNFRHILILLQRAYILYLRRHTISGDIYIYTESRQDKVCKRIGAEGVYSRSLFGGSTGRRVNEILGHVYSRQSTSDRRSGQTITTHRIVALKRAYQ
jgi:hypothetical protein